MCECVVGASCCVSMHSAGNQISVLSGPACVCSVLLPRSLTLAHLKNKETNPEYLCLYRCHIRVIDTFGTEPAYNHEEYATLHGYRTNWGYWNLNARQYMTMFRKNNMLLSASPRLERPAAPPAGSDCFPSTIMWKTEPK